MHGKVAMDFLEKFGGRYALDTMLSLLALLLGDENVLQLKGDGANSSIAASWERILGQTPQNALMQRPPLPMVIAERAMKFLSESELRNQDVCIDRKNDMLLAVETCLLWTSTVETEPIPGLSPAQKKQKWHYSILLVKHMYQKIVEADLIDEHNPDVWTIDLIDNCLRICIGVLSLVLEAGQSNVEKLRKHTRPVAGTPRPFGGRADLNSLLNEHREGQKRRQLSSDDAIGAREAAYEFISLLSTHAVRCSKNFFELPSLLLGCATHEEEILQQSVTDSLSHLLAAYVQALSSDWRQLLGAATIKDPKQLATPILPILLDAMCADSVNARRSAKEWNDIILMILDSEAASFLSLCATCIENGESAPSVTNVLDQVRGLIPSSDISFINNKDSKGVISIQSMIHSHIMELVSEWNIPYEAAQCILCDNTFSLVEAKASCQADLKTVLEPFSKFEIDESAGCTTDDIVVCEICYDEAPPDNSYSLHCGHVFCISCLRSFIDETAKENPSALLRLTCPQYKCNARITSKHLEALGDSYSQAFDILVVNSFVQSMPTHRFCPGPGCQCILWWKTELDQPRKNTVCELCSTASCFECGETPHLPASCKHVSEWKRLVGNSTFWIRSNAKPCPGCDNPIKKNGGCNHMTCKHCNTQFCWLCLTKLRFHSEAHSCNQYTETGKPSDDLERGVFLAKRYEAHEDAQLFTRDEKLSFESRPLNEIEDNYYELLQAALEVVMEARIFLKNSYIATFGLRNNAAKLAEFESHQGALEVLTEKLNQLTDMNVQSIFREKGRQSLTMHFQRLSFYQFSVCTYMTSILELDVE